MLFANGMMRASSDNIFIQSGDNIKTARQLRSAVFAKIL